MVKVFFGCSMRGGYDLVSKDELSKIQDIIEELGYKLTTRHQTQKGIMKREAKLTFSAREEVMRNIQIKKNDSYAIIGIMLASIMIYVHSLKFFGLESLPNREKHINELGKSI